MKVIESSSRPRLATGCRLQKANGLADTLVFPEGILRLKGTAAEILSRCDGQRTFAEIVIAMSGQFDAADPAQIERETELFLNRLKERGVIDF